MSVPEFLLALLVLGVLKHYWNALLRMGAEAAAAQDAAKKSAAKADRATKQVEREVDDVYAFSDESMESGIDDDLNF